MARLVAEGATWPLVAGPPVGCDAVEPLLAAPAVATPAGRGDDAGDGDDPDGDADGDGVAVVDALFAEADGVECGCAGRGGGPASRVVAALIAFSASRWPWATTNWPTARAIVISLLTRWRPFSARRGNSSRAVSASPTGMYTNRSSACSNGVLGSVTDTSSRSSPGQRKSASVRRVHDQYVARRVMAHFVWHAPENEP